jgi:DNA-binding response OmpR family regulator
MLQQKRILVIDDEVNVANLLRMNLEAEDYQVMMAFDGVEGLLQIETDPPDLIICDVMMPRMDGLELCNKVRGDTATDAIPFIFLTARTEKLETLEGFQMGADDYITKPFDMDMLVAKVRAIFNRLDRVREEG